MRIAGLAHFLILLAALAASPQVELRAQGIVTGSVLDDASGLAVTGAVVRIEALTD